jgi:hypothetical protein
MAKLRYLIICLVIIGFSTTFVVATEVDIDKLDLVSNNCDVIEEIEDRFIPLLSIITKPSEYHCKKVTTRGFLYNKMGHSPVLYFSPEMKEFGWIEYSVILPRDVRKKIASDKIEVYVTGTFIKNKSHQGLPEPAGSLNLVQIKEGLIKAERE